MSLHAHTTVSVHVDVAVHVVRRVIIIIIVFVGRRGIQCVTGTGCVTGGPEQFPLWWPSAAPATAAGAADTSGAGAGAGGGVAIKRRRGH